MDKLKKITAFRYCARCDELFKPIKRNSKICLDCHNSSGGFRKIRWK